MNDYETCMEKDGMQPRFLKALDFADSVGPNLRIFNVCRGKTGKWLPERNSWAMCGLAYPRKSWLQRRTPRSENSTVGWTGTG